MRSTCERPQRALMSTRDARRDAAQLLARSCSKACARRRPVPARTHTRRSTPTSSRAGATLPYAELAFEILSRFIDDIPAADLRALVAAHLHARTSSATRRDHAARRTLEPGVCTSLRAVERPDARLQGHRDAAARQPVRVRAGAAAAQTLNILGATSGDTGSAAEYAMRGKAASACSCCRRTADEPVPDGADVLRCRTPNIYNLAIEGVFDDCQDIVKAVSQRPRVQGARTASARSTRSTGRAWWRRSSTTSRATSRRRRSERRARVVRRAVGQLRQHLRRPRRAHDGPADRAAGRSRPTRTTCSTSSSAPAPTACARGARRTQTSQPVDGHLARRRTSSASCSTCSGRDPARVRELFARRSSATAASTSRRAAHVARVRAFGFVSGRSTHADRIATIRDVVRSATAS